MKTVTTIILILTLSLVYGQEKLHFGITTSKGINEKTSETRTIVYLGKLDFNFYKEYFYVPYYYPKKIVDPQYKDDHVTLWNDSTKVGDFKSNWSYIITYDSLSRVSSYRYSSCMICSQLPYDYHFYYNQLGQVIKMTNKLNDDKTLEFKYDTDGNIVNIKIYNYLELTQEIALIDKN